MKNSEEETVIKRMAYLLQHGGIMLSEACEKCGSPLFKINEKIVCPKCYFETKEKEPKTPTPEKTLPSSNEIPNILLNIENRILNIISNLLTEIKPQDLESKVNTIHKLIDILAKLKSIYQHNSTKNK